MIQILIFISGMIIGGMLVWLLVRKILKRKFILPYDTHTNKLENVGMSGGGGVPVLIERQIKEKEENKQRILGALEKNQRVANDDIQKLLGVSDATATRYLEELEKDGKIRQVGTAGKHVCYEKF